MTPWNSNREREHFPHVLTFSEQNDQLKKIFSRLTLWALCWSFVSTSLPFFDSLSIHQIVHTDSIVATCGQLKLKFLLCLFYCIKLYNLGKLAFTLNSTLWKSTLENLRFNVFKPDYVSGPFLANGAMSCNIFSFQQAVWHLTALQWRKWKRF